RITVVADAAVGLRRVRARPRGGITGAGGVALVGGGAGDGVAAGADPALAGVGLGAGIAVVAGSGVVGVDAAERGVAAVVGADVAVVAVERSATDAGVVHAGLEAIADVAVVAVPVRAAAARNGLVLAPPLVVAAVGRAHHPIVTAEGGAVDTVAGGRIAGLGAVADIAVVAVLEDVIAGVSRDLTVVGRAG